MKKGAGGSPSGATRAIEDVEDCARLWAATCAKRRKPAGIAPWAGFRPGGPGYSVLAATPAQTGIVLCQS